MNQFRCQEDKKRWHLLAIYRKAAINTQVIGMGREEGMPNGFANYCQTEQTSYIYVINRVEGFAAIIEIIYFSSFRKRNIFQWIKSQF